MVEAPVGGRLLVGLSAVEESGCDDQGSPRDERHFKVQVVEEDVRDEARQNDGD